MNGILQPLLAWGFSNALMLGWLAAAALPLAIHLWNKRKFREAPWAAMEFLLAAVRKNSRRMRLEQWLLLAVRTLIIALVVLAVAQPFLERIGLSFAAGERTLKVLVIDGSYSMAYKPTDRSCFDRAKQLAAEIVEHSPQGDGFALILMASPPVVVVGTPAMRHEDFLAEIEQLRMPHAGADLPATLAKLEAVLATADAARLTRKEAYFFTDLGRNTWMPELDASGAHAEYQERLTRLAAQASLTVVDLGQASSENAAITSLRTDGPLVTIANQVAISAQVRNFGLQAKNHQLAELFVDGQRVREAYVDIPPRQEVSLAFNHRFETPGPHSVEVRLGADLLDIDNHRWLSLPVREFVRVLCVNGKPATAPMTGAADYLAVALNPERDSAARGQIRPEVILESALLERDLASYDCIFLCNVGQFTASEAKALESYLKQGGGLVFFLGDQVLPERYNVELAGERSVRVIPVTIQGPSALSQYRFDPLDYRHPLVSAFQGREQAGLVTTPIFKYFRLALPDQSKAKVALKFRETGDPAIVEEPLHRGRSVVVATDGSLSSVDAGTPWSTFATWPSYLPIVRKLLTYTADAQIGERNVEVGQPLGGAIRGPAVSSLKVHTPDGRTEDLRPLADADNRRWSYADTWHSGVYTVETPGVTGPPQALAVNVNTAESDLAKIDAVELPKQFSTNRKVDLDDPSADLLSRRSGIHKNLLVAAFGLMLCEVLLAWRFGTARR